MADVQTAPGESRNPCGVVSDSLGLTLGRFEAQPEDRLSAESSLGAQLGAAAERFRISKALQRRREKAAPDLPTVALRKLAQIVDGQRPAATEARQHLQLDEDPRYLELRGALESQVGANCTGSAARRRQDAFRSLRALLLQLQHEQSAACVARQLNGVYEWYRANRDIFRGEEKGSGTPKASAGGCWTEATPSRNQPGSAFFMSSAGVQGVDEVDSAASGSMPLPDTRPRAQLPPARERLQSLERHRIVPPLTAQKLKAATGEYDDFAALTDRPFTPSTATGGQTSRSTATTPVPPEGNSRPSSASTSYSSTRRRPATARSVASALGSEPAFSSRAPTPQKLGVRHKLRQPGVVEEGEEDDDLRAEYGEAELLAAEQRMQERWLAYRHREIVTESVGKEMRSAVATWAERRARVDEEILRNAEVARYQSQLEKRGCVSPPDAADDVEATIVLDMPLASSCGVYDATRPMSAPSSSRRRFLREPQRYDVSRVTSDECETVIEANLEATRPSSSNVALTERVAHLRRIHAHLIRGVDEEGLGGTSISESDTYAQKSLVAATPMMVTQPASCSPEFRGLEESPESVTAVCGNWWHNRPTPAEASLCLDSIRFQQLQDAEAVKRALTRRNCPINSEVVDQALVMPAHKFKPNVPLFNETPCLPRSLFTPEPKKKKRSPKRKAAPRKSNGGAKTRSSPRSPGRGSARGPGKYSARP